MSSDEFDLFCTYLHLSGNKCIKSKLSIFLVLLMTTVRAGFMESSSACPLNQSVEIFRIIYMWIMKSMQTRGRMPNTGEEIKITAIYRKRKQTYSTCASTRQGLERLSPESLEFEPFHSSQMRLSYVLISFILHCWSDYLAGIRNGHHWGRTTT